MQIKILNDFIKAYENAFLSEFDDSFDGKVNNLCRSLNEPLMHLSLTLKKDLEKLKSSLSKNINLAIIGQFSSGKSSLLNLILKREILPTGVVPVTFKPTFLRYAKDYALRVEFDDGSDFLTSVSELENYTDQRKNGDFKEAKALHIFAPIEILKNITLIDTPGLNANDMDTLTTFSQFENIHGVIWLSLIDNAGKKSEEDTIKSHLSLFGANSICVLNQKDKLNESELNNVLGYAKGVFGKYFKDVIAISCKQAKENELEKSNFPLLLNYFETLDIKALKQNYAKRKLLEVIEILESENALFDSIFDKALNYFDNYESYLSEFSKTLSEQIKILNHKILEQLKSISERIGAEIFKAIKEKDEYFYKEAQGLFKKDLYQKYEYKAPAISSDDAFLAMFYHSDVMSKEFKRIKKELCLAFDELKANLNESFYHLSKEILLFKSKFSNIQKDNLYQSEANFSKLRAFANASDEYFLKDFEKNLFKTTLELDLFLEKLNLKAFANYENATKISLSFFSRKINESKVFYELDSSQFSLFYPKKSEIYERVLHELNAYEFEELLISKPVILKIVNAFFHTNSHIINDKKALIMSQKNELKIRLNHLKNIKNELDKL